LGDDNKVLAIYLLGELRPSDATSVELLIQNIDLKATRFDLKTDFPRWGQYPAVEALIKVGEPAVILILNELPNETNQLRRQLLCEVLKRVWRAP
jgi:HEAT repeat protein